MLRTIVPSTTAVTMTGVGGALATLAVWLIESLTTLTVPAEVAVAFATVFGAVIGHAAGFIAGERSAVVDATDKEGA